MNKITVIHQGQDSWVRDIYKNKENERINKKIDSPNFPTPHGLYTVSKDGEPDCPLKKDLKVVFIKTLEGWRKSNHVVLTIISILMMKLIRKW